MYTKWNDGLVQFIFMDSTDASGMMGMEQVRSSTPMNVMHGQQTSQMMMHGQ